jgi:hypothetical protein
MYSNDIPKVRVEVCGTSREVASRDRAQNIYSYTTAAIVAVSGPVGPLPVPVVQQQVPSLRTSVGN